MSVLSLVLFSIFPLIDSVQQVPGTSIEVRQRQLAKALSPMCTMLDGKDTEVAEEQLEYTAGPSDCTAGGTGNICKLVHKENAPLSTTIGPLWLLSLSLVDKKLTVTRAEQRSNALAPMRVTLDGMLMVCRAVHPSKEDMPM